MSNEEKVSKQAPKIWKTGPGEVDFLILSKLVTLSLLYTVVAGKMSRNCNCYC